MVHDTMTRGSFLRTALGAAGAAVAGCTAPAPRVAADRDEMLWGALLHLGHNMWDDFAGNPDALAKSEAELAEKPGPMGTSGRRASRYRAFVRTSDDEWRKTSTYVATAGHKLLFIDLGEAVAFPSHPELAVTGTWSVGKFRKELQRLRALGLEPAPKLNFSACHDAWLKEYHRMLSSRKYYQVVADVIRDAIEIFDTPRFMHIGYDEEFAEAQFNHFHTTVRKGDLWWHDLNYTIDQVTRRGVRPVMWSDAMWTGRAEFVRRMSKEPLQSNWYYRSDFSAKRCTWNYAFEKRGGWGETVNGAAAFEALEKAGFDQLPCCSNWAEYESTDVFVKYCREHIDPSRLKGFYTAPWGSPNDPKKYPTGVRHVLNGLDLLKAAREKHYAKA